VDPLTLIIVLYLFKSLHQYHISKLSSTPFLLLSISLFVVYTVNLPVVWPWSCRVIYYFGTPALGRRYQSFGRVKDQEKTTFTSSFGTFAYRRMPFGLCNAPATFQRCMLSIFSDMVERFLKIFMDDFSIFGDSFDDYLTNWEKVLSRCEEKNLVLNWEKCHFMVTNGIVVGHIVSSKGIEVDKSKIELIANLPTPKSIKDVRSFLRHASFYRRFIKDFSVIS